MKTIENKNLRIKLHVLVDDYMKAYFPGFKVERFRITAEKVPHFLIDAYRVVATKEEEN